MNNFVIYAQDCRCSWQFPRKWFKLFSTACSFRWICRTKLAFTGLWTTNWGIWCQIIASYGLNSCSVKFAYEISISKIRNRTTYGWLMIIITKYIWQRELNYSPIIFTRSKRHRLPNKQMKTNMVFFVSTDMTGESPESTIDNISAWDRGKQAWHKKSVWNAFSVLWSEGK